MDALMMPAEGDLPGLVDVYFDDGRVRTDVTIGQLFQLRTEGWNLKFVPRPR